MIDMENEDRGSMIRNLTTGRVSTTLVMFAFPMILANLLQAVYGMVGMVVVGQFVGRDGLSAVSIGSGILHMFTLLAMGLCNAGQVIISQYVGAGDTKSVSRTIGTMFSLVLLTSIGFTVIALLGSGVFLNLLNTPPEAYESALVYCRTSFSALFFMFGYNLVSAILRGMGDSRHPLIFIGLAAITNLLLDLLFIAVLSMGTFGAALSTVISQGLSFIISVAFLFRRRKSFNFDFKPQNFKADRGILRSILKLGVPFCLQNAAISFSVLFVNSFINVYGVAASAVTGIGEKLGTVTYVVTGSITMAGSSMIGQSLGAGKQERVSQVIRFAMLINAVFAALLTSLTILIPERIFGLFNNDPEVLSFGMQYVPCAVLTYIGFALRSPFFALINGVGNGKLNLAVGLLDGVVCRIGLAILLGVSLGIGIRGFWYGSVIAGYMPILIGGAYYISGKWKSSTIIISR